MRITNSIILRGYNRDLNRLMNLKTACERRITSTRKFSRASEAPLSAAKALNVRKSLYYSEQYRENLSVANKFYTEAETSLLQVSDKVAEVRELLIAACNTTKDQTEYNIYSQQLEKIVEGLVSVFNTNSAERAIFGGESDDAMPFTLIKDSFGNLATVLYHGVPLNAMTDPKKYPYSTPVTVDVGLGMVMDQKTQYTDPLSVLDISFNGAEITGCGAEKSTADIDLTSLKPNRKYCIDVYVGGIKKTIEFTAKESREDTLKELNNALKQAYKKEVAYGKIEQPMVDDSGVIYCEGQLVSAVNNPNHPTAEKLVIDNDAGYTDKFKLDFDKLEEGKEYTIKVTVGNETKEITFEAGTDADRDTRNDITVANLQAALDDAFGVDVDEITGKTYSKVAVSTNPVTKGCISAEGQRVTVRDESGISTGSAVEARVTSKTYGQINLANLTNGQKYTVTVNGVDVTFEGGVDLTKTMDNLSDAVYNAGLRLNMQQTGDDKGTVYFTNASGEYATVTKSENVPANSEALPVSKGTKYSVDLEDIKEGQEYALKVVYNNKTKVINFVGGADANETQKNLQNALAGAFGTNGTANVISVGADGLITAADGNSVSVSTMKLDKDYSAVQREAIYSDNYLQLALDAARALRNGDLSYANGCIDRIVSASEHLLVKIAELGSNEDFIEFNTNKLITREYNLYERQNELEVTEAEKEITLWKTYEALYNACLQMSSSVIPNSIFNYIR